MNNRAFAWLLVNSAFVAALWFGFVGGVEGAKSTAVFWVWFSFIVSLFVVSEDVSRKMVEDGPSVPLWLNLSLDMAIVVFLVWHGRWGLGILLLIQAILMNSVHTVPKCKKADA